MTPDSLRSAFQGVDTVFVLNPVAADELTRKLLTLRLAADTAVKGVLSMVNADVTSTTGWACRRELQEGSLVELFRELRTIPIPVFAYFPMGRATRTAARAIIDYLCASLQDEAEAERAPA